MANISEAWGNITLQAPTKETLAKLLTLIECRLNHNEYSTVIPDYEVYPTTNVDEIYQEILKRIEDNAIRDENGYSITAGFSGSGRWCYRSNIEFFKKWINQSVQNYRFGTPEDTKRADQILNRFYQEIENQAIVLHFCFEDQDPAMELAYRAEVTLDWKTGISTIIKYEDIPFIPDSVAI